MIALVVNLLTEKVKPQLLWWTIYLQWIISTTNKKASTISDGFKVNKLCSCYHFKDTLIYVLKVSSIKVLISINKLYGGYNDLFIGLPPLLSSSITLSSI